MKAAVLEEFDQPLALRELERLPLADHDVVVEITATGVCHSDLHALEGTFPSAFFPPMVLGHEGVGRVLEVGSRVSRVEVGDHVLGTFIPVCGSCYQCRRDRTHLCEFAPQTHGTARWRGAEGEVRSMVGLGTMAEVCIAHEFSWVKIESTLPDSQIALIGCGVTTGVGAALWTARVEPGASVAVFGCGGVGTAVVQGCRIAGATQIIAVDPVEEKRASAVRFGATHSVDPSSQDAIEAIRELTDGRLVDYSFEVVGNTKTMRSTYDAAGKGGVVTFVGSLDPELLVELPAQDIHAQGKKILGSTIGSARVLRDMQKIIDMVESGQFDLGGMVANITALDNVNAAFDDLKNGRGLRTVLVP